MNRIATLIVTLAALTAAACGTHTQGAAMRGCPEPDEVASPEQRPVGPNAAPATRDEAHGAPATTKLLPTAEEFRLDNGLRVLLVTSHEVPLVTFQARLYGGSSEDPAGKEGATDLLAELLTKGAGERDAAAFQEAVDFEGGTFGATAAARWIDVDAEFMAEDTGLALDLLADVLQRPRLEDAEFENERGLALDGLSAARDQPASLVGTYWLGWEFGAHPFGRTASGDETSFAALTAADVRARAATTLTASRTLLAVAGDIDAADMRKQIEKRFGDWKAGAAAAAVPAPGTPKPGRVLVVDKPDALQTYFRFGGAGIAWTHEDYPARYLANTILGGRFTSRLNQVLRVEKGLTYGAGSGFSDSLGGLFFVSTYTQTDKSRECMQLALATYLKFRDEGITQEELDSARAYAKGQYAPGSVETAEQSAGMLVALASDGMSRDVIDGLFAHFDELTLEDVNAMIRRTFPKREALSWVAIGQASALSEFVSELGEVTTVPLAGPGFAPRD